MTGGWAATNTLREALSYNTQGPEVMLATEAAALALVEAALDAAANLVAIEDEIADGVDSSVDWYSRQGGAVDVLAAALRAVREGK